MFLSYKVQPLRIQHKYQSQFWRQIFRQNIENCGMQMGEFASTPQPFWAPCKQIHKNRVEHK